MKIKEINMFDMIPLTVWYSLPLVVFFGTTWFLQSRQYARIDSHMKILTKHAAQDVARRLLSQESLNVTIDRSEDYTHNDYDREKGKILLSPNTIDQKDCTSIGHALVAVEHALHERRKPHSRVMTRKLQLAESVSIWGVFTILAFGFMSVSLPVVLVGYSCGIVPLTIHTLVQKGNISRGTDLLKTLESMEMFSKEEMTALQEVVRVLITRH